MRNVDVCYFKEYTNDAAGVRYRVEVLPGYPAAGPRGSSITFEELPDGVVVAAADIAAACDKIPIGIIDAPSITVTLELQLAPANFQTIVLDPHPTADEFTGDTNFANWYADAVSTTWTLKRKVGSGDWQTRFVGVQRIAPGITVTEYISDDRTTTVRKFEAEILSIGGYLMQNTFPAKLRAQIDAIATPMDVKYKAFLFDVVKAFDVSGTTRYVGTVCVAWDGSTGYGSIKELEFYRFKLIFTAAQSLLNTLYQVLRRSTSYAATIASKPHEKVTLYKQVSGDVIAPDDLYFVGKVNATYRNDKLHIVVPNCATGGLLTPKDIKITTGVPSLPYVRVANDASIDSYSNLYDLFKDIAENFATKFTWKVEDDGIVYRFDRPFDATTGDHKTELKKKYFASKDGRVQLVKNYAYNALRAAECSIDGVYKSDGGDDKFTAENSAMTASETKFEAKVIFHNVPDVPSDEQLFIRADGGGVVSGYEMQVNVCLSENLVCSKLVAFETLIPGPIDNFQIEFVYGSSAPFGDQRFGVCGPVPVRVANKVSIGGVDYDTDELDDWNADIQVNGYPWFVGELLFIGRTACLPLAVAKQILKEFGNRSQVQFEVNIETTRWPIAVRNVADVYTIEPFDSTLDDKLQRGKLVALSITERVTDTLATISFFIPGV